MDIKAGTDRYKTNFRNPDLGHRFSNGVIRIKRCVIKQLFAYFSDV